MTVIVTFWGKSSGIPVAAFPVTGPVHVIASDKVSKLDDDLKKAISEALQLGAQDCPNYAFNYSWAYCPEQFLLILSQPLKRPRKWKVI